MYHSKSEKVQQLFLFDLFIHELTGYIGMAVQSRSAFPLGSTLHGKHFILRVEK
jgi:hypothetical protein